MNTSVTLGKTARQSIGVANSVAAPTLGPANVLAPFGSLAPPYKNGVIREGLFLLLPLRHNGQTAREHPTAGSNTELSPD